MITNSAKWLYNVIGRRKWLIVLLLLIQSLIGGSSVVYALLLKRIIDNAVSGNKNGFIAFFIGMILLILAQILLGLLSRGLTEYSKASIENALKKRLFENLLYRDYSQVSAVHSGEWMNRLTNDTVVCANAATTILPGLAGMVVKMIGAVIMILIIEPRFALILIPGAIAIFLLTYAFRKVLKKLHKRIQESDGKLRIFLQERLESMPVVRSFTAEEQCLAEAEEKMQDHKKARMKRINFSNLCNLGFSGAMNGMYLIGIGYGGYGIINHTITYGTMTAVLQLIAQIQAPLANISGYLPTYFAMTASAERLIKAETFNKPDEMPMSSREMKSFYKNSFKGFGLKDAGFSYSSDDNSPIVLSHLDLEIRKGDYVAVTGHSGCGKSTILKLFMGLYSLDSGEKYMIAENTHKMTDKYRSLFAYVPQGNQLMSGKIRNIISLSDRERAHDDESIMNAMKIACADDFYDTLRNGLDTELGEKGQGLSEGQMQRIAVARAIFSDYPIILLDEATSSLDEGTEKRLLENLKTMTDKTVLIVTHRPSALEICNKQIQMSEDGVKMINR